MVKQMAKNLEINALMINIELVNKLIIYQYH